MNDGTSRRPQGHASVGVLPSSHWQLPKATAFWLLTLVFGLLLFSAGAPTPLYAVYQAQWHFSPTILTIVFAIYGLGVLGALFAFGALSDRIGRRPVLAAALMLILLSMVLFAAARNVDWLIVARVVQGVAVGMASTALSATVIELEPDMKPGFGALIGATAPSLGLASGSLVTGVFVDFGPSPTLAVYLALVVAFTLALVVVFFMPETAKRNAERAHLWRPRRISVPPEVRGRFALLSIGTAATWAIGGFYLSLGPSLAAELLHSQQRTVGGIVVFALIGLGSLTTMLLHSWTNLRAGYFGSFCMVVGLLLVLHAVSTGSTPIFFIGSVVLGMGWGPSYMAAFRAIVEIAPPQHRAEILAAIYVVNYVFFSVPAIAAGVVATRFGLHTAVLSFGAVVTLMGAISGFGVHAAQRSAARGAKPVPAMKHEPCPVPCTVPHLVDCTH